MADYLIGDVQGCFNSLNTLLRKINFRIDRDKLFFLGDVVNRGKQSLATLDFIQSSTDNTSMVLGNHDFHLLACALGVKNPTNKDTFTDVLSSKKRTQLIDFLLQQPLLIQHKGALLVHAGIPPQWGAKEALKQAKKVSQHLQSEQVSNFIQQMYHNEPSQWHLELSSIEKCRYSVNALMRMRFCNQDAQLEFTHKDNFSHPPQGYQAWFLQPNRILKEVDIFFGHWSTLKQVNCKHIYPLDTGCIWGGKLSALRLEDKKVFSIAC
jgi:bis(5'-nucleosyl)-tetraphosphatase (symmetrical)